MTFASLLACLLSLRHRPECSLKSEFTCVALLETFQGFPGLPIALSSVKPQALTVVKRPLPPRRAPPLPPLPWVTLADCPLALVASLPSFEEAK